jgi:hypothetical protein
MSVLRSDPEWIDAPEDGEGGCIVKHQDQTVNHDPPHTYGDCWRTTIANLLGLDVSDVPHFLHDGCEKAEALRRLNAFLRTHGLCFIDVGIDRAFLETVGIAGLHHEAGGRTVRNTDHAGAFCDGQLLHDPHPSHAGFTELHDGFGLFVALRPWELVRKNGDGQ